jgi:hypothetical protein
MNMNMRTRTGAVLATTAAALTVAGPALAASLTATDPQDIDHGVDLRKVKVYNGEANLKVTLTHVNLRKSFKSGASGSVYIDTDPTDKGPEYVFSGGFYEGTDYMLSRTEGFGVKKWGKPVKCSYQLRLDYAEEKTRMRIGQGCLGDVDQVRIAVKVAGERTDGSIVTDWLGEPREFTDWAARG